DREGLAEPGRHRATGPGHPGVREVVDSTLWGRSGRRRGGDAVEAARGHRGPEVVVGGAGAGVLQRRVGRADLLEALLVARIGVAVRVEALRQLPVAVVDLARCRGRVDAEDAVVVGARPLPSA